MKRRRERQKTGAKKFKEVTEGNTKKKQTAKKNKDKSYP